MCTLNTYKNGGGTQMHAISNMLYMAGVWAPPPLQVYIVMLPWFAAPGPLVDIAAAPVHSIICLGFL